MDDRFAFRDGSLENLGRPSNAERVLRVRDPCGVGGDRASQLARVVDQQLRSPGREQPIEVGQHWTQADPREHLPKSNVHPLVARQGPKIRVCLCEPRLNIAVVHAGGEHLEPERHDRLAEGRVGRERDFMTRVRQGMGQRHHRQDVTVADDRREQDSHGLLRLAVASAPRR